MTKAEYEAKNQELRDKYICDSDYFGRLVDVDSEYIESLEDRIAELEKHLETSVSKFELDTCRQLNEALRQREDRMRKAMRNAGFVWSEDEFKEIGK